MKLRELFFKAKNRLDDVVTIEDIYWLIEDIYHISRGEIALHYEDEIDDFVFFCLFERLKKEPIQYVLGYGYFLNKKYVVSKDVLIPRNETEELVLHLEKMIKEKDYKSVLDIGVGSGAISISLKLNNPSLLVEGVDISSSALKVANINKEKHNVDVNYYLSDVYENVINKYDVIVSNPPYIDEEEYVMDRVKENEPHIALYAKNKGMYVYEKIIKDAHKYLNHDGLLAFEIDPLRKDDLIKLIDIHLKGSTYTFIKDINGYIRFCFINVL